jgi:hypothetical protein
MVLLKPSRLFGSTKIGCKAEQMQQQFSHLVAFYNQKDGMPSSLLGTSGANWLVPSSSSELFDRPIYLAGWT